MSQAHWQYSAESVIIGTLKGSSILQDQRKSEVNKAIAERIEMGNYWGVNLIELGMLRLSTDVCTV